MENIVAFFAHAQLVSFHGCQASGCGTSAARGEVLSDETRRRIEDHPCYSEKAHHHFARMHVAVAPACNIQCHYCNRKYDCANESRPGVVSELLTPEQAVKKAVVVAAAMPQLAVVGIAGPGDPLANPERTFATFRMLAERVPDLKLCLSTNGLALPHYVDELARLHIDHVTITINCLDADIGAEIYPWIFWKHKRIRGRAAAEILIEQQQKGLEMLIARGILVKVNSVLIPGVNDEHLKTVSACIKEKGALLHNIMPLISAPEHGTYYGVMGQRSPTPEELKALQDACEGNMAMMRHCRQCRADAIGLLGEDRASEFTLDKIETMTITDDFLAAARQRRMAWREKIAAERKATEENDSARRHQQAVITLHRQPRPAFLHAGATELEVSGHAPVNHSPSKSDNVSGRTVLMAVAAKNGLVAEHFGHAREFLVYEVSASGAKLVGHRKTDLYCVGSAACGENEDTLEKTIQALAGCEVVLCAKIGYEPWKRLEAAGILPNGEHPWESVESACMAVWHEMHAAGKLASQVPAQKVA